MHKSKLLSPTGQTSCNGNPSRGIRHQQLPPTSFTLMCTVTQEELLVHLVHHCLHCCLVWWWGTWQDSWSICSRAAARRQREVYIHDMRIFWHVKPVARHRGSEGLVRVACLLVGQSFLYKHCDEHVIVASCYCMISCC